jgi:solute carrier family 25 protein 16
MQVAGLELQQAGPAGAAPAGQHHRAPRMMETARHILQESGPRGLFRGLHLNFLKVVPSTAIGFTTYDFIKSYLGLHTP